MLLFSFCLLENAVKAVLFLEELLQAWLFAIVGVFVPALVIFVKRDVVFCFVLEVLTLFFYWSLLNLFALS